MTAISLTTHSALNRAFQINSGFCLSNPRAKKERRENVKSYNFNTLPLYRSHTLCSGTPTQMRSDTSNESSCAVIIKTTLANQIRELELTVICFFLYGSFKPSDISSTCSVLFRISTEQSNRLFWLLGFIILYFYKILWLLNRKFTMNHKPF